MTELERTMENLKKQQEQIQKQMKEVAEQIKKNNERKVVIDFKTFCDITNALETGIATDELKSRLYAIGKNFENKQINIDFENKESQKEENKINSDEFVNTIVRAINPFTENFFL